MTPSTQSLWSTHDPRPTNPLDADLDADVAIIGAGITGLTAALKLAEAGKTVVVLEARMIGSGVTGGTSAHVTEAVDARYKDLSKHFGVDGARLVAQSSRAALEHIASRVAALDIACDLQRVSGYLYTEDASKRDELVAEHAAATEAGLNVELDALVGVPFAIAGSIRFADQLRFLPLDYVRGLAGALAERGVRVHEQTRVTKIEEGEAVVLTTEGGWTVRARSVFCATHTPLNLVRIHTKLSHEQSYVMAFAAPAGVEDALLWDTADPYHYTRLAVVDGKQWLIVGGEDHATGEEEHPASAFERLGAYAREKYGVTDEGYRWSAQVVSSVDGLPFIGRNGGSKNVYIATGFGGNGLTFGTISALLVSDLVLGIDNPWTALYHTTRLKLSALGDIVKAQAHVPAHLLGHTDVKLPSEIAIGQGAVLKQDGKHLAVYRDAEGTLHGVSARCTHAGCMVAFNDAERSWDCPCHGSRFATDGSILEGPAVVQLECHHVRDE